MTIFQAFFAMSEHVCHFGTHENDSFALSEHFPFRNNFFCHVGTFFHFGTQLFAISEHGLFRNGNHLYNLRYCTKSSSSLDWKRMDFVNSQFTDMTLEQRLNQGFYFCANDLINVSNLKQGTLTHAQNDCSRSQIMTPDICHNTTITDTIIDVVREARIRFNIGSEISQMWTSIRRHNATHFSNGNKWFVGTDLGLAIFLYNQQFLIEHLLEDASKSMSNTNV